jgi:ABC-type nitrate/sulfonate/bicarbonate transport system substrate-binding protein
MVESLANRHVDGFCVGAPWNSVAIDLGIGRILHFGCEIVARCSEKVLAVRHQWAAENRELVEKLVRALANAAAFIADGANRPHVASLIAPRIGAPLEAVQRTLAGTLRVSADAERRDPRYLVINMEASRPDPMQAAWLYAQMVRWNQAPMTGELLVAARAVMSPAIYDSVLGCEVDRRDDEPLDGVGVFTGPLFDPADGVGRTG